MPAVNFGGLASGLDTQALIQAILDFERQPLNRIQNRRALFNEQKSALNELNSKLGEFESALRKLSSTSNFRGRVASSSDDGALRVTPGVGAEIGLFQVEVNTLAAANKVKSDGLAESDQALVSDGTLTIQSGSNTLIQIDVDAASGNNTLAQVRDAINVADAGVRAAIINDGTSYRLTVRAEETGTANALSITDTTNLNLAAAGNSVTAAADASITVDNIVVTSSSNQISGVIPGVTLDLIAETEGTPVTVEISQDNDRIVDNVEDLVSSFNEVLGFLNRQFSRESPGPLATDSTARSVHQRLLTLFTSGVDGIPFGGIRSLSSIGVEFDGKTGEASLNASTLRDLLETEFEAVGNLFLSSGQATDPRIQFLASSSGTLPGTYSVEITAPAEKALATATGTITTLAQDETLTIGDGTDSIDVALTSGSTAQQVVDALNAALAASDVDATAFVTGGVLNIASKAYGSTATVTVQSDRAQPPGPDSQGTGFYTDEVSGTGQDVQGRIDGVDATGAGQVLTAAQGGDSSGLRLRVTATAAVVASLGGDFGSISFSRGLVPTLVAEVDTLTRIGDGPVDLARELLDSRIKQLNDDILRFEERLTDREARLAQAFAQAESAIQSLQSQQNAFGAI